MSDATTSAVVDPVCGMEVDPSSAAARAEHNGETYHFCSHACKTKFDAEPAKYAGRVPAGDGLTQKAAVDGSHHTRSTSDGAGSTQQSSRNVNVDARKPSTALRTDWMSVAAESAASMAASRPSRGKAGSSESSPENWAASASSPRSANGVPFSTIRSPTD